MRLALNFISDIATPHVNELLRALAARDDVDLRLWYSANAKPEQYGWKVDPTHQVLPAIVFGSQRPSSSLILHAARHRDEAFLVCGWSNPTTRVLVPLLGALSKRFGFFTDLPNESSRRTAWREWGRRRYLAILRSRALVFAVGNRAVSYFVSRGFPPNRVINLPLPVPVPDQLAALRQRRDEFRHRVGAGPSDFLIVTGSRLVPDKGFDLLLRSITKLSPDDRERIRLLIVGSGPEEMNLKALAQDLGLGDRVKFEPWMDFPDFCGYMSAANLVVHPARFDAYGGITLTAVALGVPVVGSKGAGAALDLIDDGKTGFLYDAENVDDLAGHIRYFLGHPEELERFAIRSRDVAAARSAANIANVLVEHMKRGNAPL
jgi:glycosyltransferase involved in cell wall biosynthesis